jgi:hypothetical protein
MATQKTNALQQPLPVVTPLIGISFDKGLLIAVMTQPEEALLTDFRMAVDKPYYRMLTAPKPKCHSNNQVTRDQNAGVDRRAYVAFIPAPARAVIEGQVPCGAKVGKESVYFSVPVEQLSRIDTEKLRKVLYVLLSQFEVVLPLALPPEHPLREQLAPLIEAKHRRAHWQKVQDKVSEHLKAKEYEKSLDLLVPLAFSSRPLPEAEKLLGDLLYAAYRAKTEGAEAASAPDSQPVELVALRKEQLLLELALSRLSPAPEKEVATPLPKATKKSVAVPSRKAKKAAKARKQVPVQRVARAPAHAAAKAAKTGSLPRPKRRRAA